MVAVIDCTCNRHTSGTLLLIHDIFISLVIIIIISCQYFLPEIYTGKVNWLLNQYPQENKRWKWQKSQIQHKAFTAWSSCGQMSSSSTTVMYTLNPWLHSRLPCWSVACYVMWDHLLCAGYWWLRAIVLHQVCPILLGHWRGSCHQGYIGTEGYVTILTQGTQLQPCPTGIGMIRSILILCIN